MRGSHSRYAGAVPTNGVRDHRDDEQPLAAEAVDDLPANGAKIAIMSAGIATIMGTSTSAPGSPAKMRRQLRQDRRDQHRPEHGHATAGQQERRLPGAGSTERRSFFGLLRDVRHRTSLRSGLCVEAADSQRLGLRRRGPAVGEASPSDRIAAHRQTGYR